MSKLSQVTRGRQSQLPRCLFYGVEGVGKSSLAADAPEPIYLDLESGTGQLNCARYPITEDTKPADRYAEVLAAIDELQTEEHSYKTLVIDTVDALEPLLLDAMCKRDQKASIDKYGHGRGYQVALDEWRALLHKLDGLRKARSMNVVLLGHAHIKTFSNPQGEDYDRYTLKIIGKAAGLLKEWCDLVGFINYAETIEPSADERKPAKAYSSGRRVIHTQRTSAYDAKSRLLLPTEVPLLMDTPWAPFAEAITLANMSTSEFRKAITVELKRLNDPELTSKVNAACETAADNTMILHQYLQNLKER